MNAADVEAAADQIWRNGKKPTMGRLAAILDVRPADLVQQFLDDTSDEAIHLASLSEVARHAAALKYDWQTLIWGDSDLDDAPIQPATGSSARHLPAPSQPPAATPAVGFLAEPARPRRVDVARRHNAGPTRTRGSARSRRHASTS